ncbi:MAG TPA: cupin domain-containing protein, partial [Thermoanaerobaculia bacterium]|nr:cupin domain-containing protein [Thermoanaerobaculia bacterium]
LRLVRHAQYAAPESYLRFRPNRRGSAIPEIVPEQFTKLLREGYTLILDAIEEMAPAIRELAVSLESLFHEVVQVNLYTAWRDLQGFDVHWDDHDVLILQVYGRKQWRVYRGGRENPLNRDVEPNTEPPEELAWEGELRDGDVLYLPRGWWHEAAGCGEPTLHLTFGIPKRTGINLVQWLADELRAVTEFRADLPRFADAEARTQHMQKLRDALLARWDETLLDRYLASEDERARPRAWVNLPLAAQDEAVPPLDAVVSLAVARPAAIANGGASITIRALGREWELAAGTEPAFRRLLDGPATVEELAGMLDGTATVGQTQTFVADLARRGLLAVRHGG